MVLLTLTACDATLSLDAADTAAPGSGIEPVGDAPAAPPDRDEPEFFDDRFIHEVAITLSDDAKRDLRGDPYAFTEGSVTVDGDAFARVGVRIRGKIGSYRTLLQKPKFKIDFNRYVSDQRLGVHEVLALNNEVVDCSYLREPAGYAVFRAAGLPAPRTVFTRLTINGAPYGLYVAIEYPDDTFLDDRWEDGSGNLYDGKYVYFGNGAYQLVDFTPDLADGFQLEEGDDVGRADIYAIRDALSAPGTFEERFGGLIDLEQFHRHLAVEQWVGHNDGYALNQNNYRVYFDPSDGRADFLPYDLDYGFLYDYQWGMSWASPRGALAAQCWADAACVAAQATAVREVVAAVDTDALLAQYDTWAALIAEDAAADPRRECPTTSVTPDQAYVRAWLAQGSANLAAWWGVGGG
jgi:hypothetical protein